MKEQIVMAKFQRYAYNEIDDGEYYYIVETDNGTDRKRFDNEEEARTYYRHLQQLDDQHRVVEQIESLQRSIIRPNKVIQKLDPEYEEWLRFKKETDPAFIIWKREKEAEAERIRKRQEEEAERQRINIEIQERKRKEQEIARKQKQEEELKENQRIIEPLVASLLQRKKLSWEQRCQIAKYTNNKLAIKKLKYDNSVKVLDALLTNPYIDSATIQHIHKRKQDKLDSKIANQEITKESKDDSGCLKPLITMIIIVGSIVILVNIIASLI